MASPKHPFEKDHADYEELEVILIDDNNQEGNEGNSLGYRDSLKSHQIKYPLLVRFIFILAALCALGWMIGLVICTAIFGLLACATFLQVKSFILLALRSWSFLKTATIGLMSAILASINPPLGMGLFMLYFSLKPNAKEESYIQRMVKNYYNKF